MQRTRAAWPLLTILALSCVLVAQDPRPSLEAEGRLPDHWLGPGPVHKLQVDAGDPLGDELRQSGSVLREWDYGSFSLFVVDGADVAELAAAGALIRDEHDLLAVSGWLLDGTRPGETRQRLPEALRFAAGMNQPLHPGLGLYLVKYEAPVRDEWRQALEATGAQVVQSMANNAFVVQAPAGAVARLEALVSATPAIQHLGPWHPAYRMSASIRAAAAGGGGFELPVTVQLVNGRGLRDALELLGVLGSVSLAHTVGPYVNVAVDLDPVYFEMLAKWPEVFALELRGTPARQDERQGQLVAGNIIGSFPAGPGYLDWLAGEGFNASQFGSFSVNVVDDSVGLSGHPDLVAPRVSFALNPTGQGITQRGHGFLNAHILAGFNDGTGFAVEDAQGYQYGLGIAPWARVGSTAIFGPNAGSMSSWEDDAYVFGARISSNSWNLTDQFLGPIADYDSNAQEADFLVRDASSTLAGNQQYSMVFAAGNNGPGPNTVSTPSTAKNVITVGASENVRPTGNDGCGISNSGADDLHDVISFSSHGPVDSAGGDGRYKPELVAPGTHIQGGVPQSNYSGAGLCNAFWPIGSTLYGWASGTSHAAPAVSGGAALVYQDFLNNGLGVPSPAMVKAVLLNSARYLDGTFAGGSLPSNSQGMGLLNLGRAFDDVDRMVVDQTHMLAGTGFSFGLAGQVADPGEPFRVTLAWTDAAGPTTGAPWVNDLDLVVSVGGVTYRGNVFSGESSIAGGTADVRNNNESVFLPLGTGGPFAVTVMGSNIGGDGVPGNGDPSDQDFALIVYNGNSGSAGPVAAFVGDPVAGTTPLSVDFTDLSFGAVDTWDWDFGDTGSSSAQNPTHLYAASGTYTVSLSVSGPAGAHVRTRTDYIEVKDPPPPGITDGSFESQLGGGPPGSPWVVSFGTGHKVNPTLGASDVGMPSDGVQWVEIVTNSTDGATPPSVPGGMTDPPLGGAGIQQSFTYPPGSPLLEFSGVFLRGEDPDQPLYNDWMSVDISDGTTTWNVFYKDTFSATAGIFSSYGLPVTPVEDVSVDLTTLFPSSTSSTDFTLTACVGNAFDDFQDSKGYVDHFRMTSTAPPWQDLGGGTIGLNGKPELFAAGPLVAGSDLVMDLTKAPANALMLLAGSLSSAPTNVVGGTLYATPFALKALVLADAAGEFHVLSTVQPGSPSGVDVFFQFIVQDLSIPHKITLSNARTATTP
jgi:PKD repeat protein